MRHLNALVLAVALVAGFACIALTASPALAQRAPGPARPARPVGEPPLCSPVIVDGTPDQWWTRNRDSYYAAEPAETPEGVLTANMPTKPVEPETDPFALSEAMTSLTGKTEDTAAAASLGDDLVEALTAFDPGLSANTLADDPHTFLVIAASFRAHRRLRLEPMFTDEKGRLDKDYERVKEFVNSLPAVEFLAQMRTNAFEDDETVSAYLQRMLAALPRVESSTVRAVSALPKVAARLAGLALSIVRQLANDDARFSIAWLPSSDRDMEDLLFLLARALPEWVPTGADPEDARAEIGPIAELRAALEANLHAYMAEVRKDGKFGRNPWPDFYEAIHEDLDAMDSHLVNLLLLDQLRAISGARLRFDDAYKAEYTRMKALATFQLILRSERAELFPRFRVDRIDATPTSGARAGDLAVRLDPTIENAAVEMLMIMRYFNNANADELQRVVFATRPSDAYPSYREGRVGSATGRYFDEAKALLTELARHKPSVVIPLIDRAIEDDAAYQRADTYATTDLVMSTYWGTHVVRLRLTPTSDFGDQLDKLREAVMPRLSLAAKDLRRDGAAAKLLALPQPADD